MVITYQLTILDPQNTLNILSERYATLHNWLEVELQINSDKARFYDCSKLPIKYQANDGAVNLTGSFGV